MSWLALLWSRNVETIVLGFPSMTGIIVDISGRWFMNMFNMSMMLQNLQESGQHWSWHSSDATYSGIMTLWHALYHPVSITHSLNLNIWLRLYLPHSQTISLWSSVACSLKCSPWHTLSDINSLTCSLCHYYLPNHNKNVTRSNLNGNTRKLACIFPH